MTIEDENKNKINKIKVKQPNSRHCFVCGIENAYGLKLQFYETATGEVTVETVVPDHYQGFPGIVHGGIIASLVDEVLARAHMGSNPEQPRFMYTAKLTVHYRIPVRTNTPIRIVGKAMQTKKRFVTSIAEIYGPDDIILAEAEAILVNVPEDTINKDDLVRLGWNIYPD